jgi:hypothetical protein
MDAVWHGSLELRMKGITICFSFRLNTFPGPVVEKLDTPNDSYHIILEARGSEFTVRIRVLSTPRPDDPQKLAVFNDDTFQIGGIGFRGFDDSRALIQGLIVRPKSRN